MKHKLMRPIEKKRFLDLQHVGIKDMFYIALFLLISYGVIKWMQPVQITITRPVEAEVIHITPSITRTPTPTPFVVPEGREEIADYVKEVFGRDSDKAFLLLSCENKSLNPDTVNTDGNEPVGSRDTGVFQINEYWQQVQYKYLLNWKINIEIAYQLYTENGNTFSMWTCGQKLGI